MSSARHADHRRRDPRRYVLAFECGLAAGTLGYTNSWYAWPSTTVAGAAAALAAFRWYPRASADALRRLSIALLATIAAGVAADILVSRLSSAPIVAIVLFAIAIPVIACLRREIAAVPQHLRTPGRRLVLVLVVGAVIVGVGFRVLHGALRPTAYGLAVGASLGVLMAAFWWFPRWQSSRWPSSLTVRDRIELEDKARSTLGQLLSGLGLVVTVAVTLYSVAQSRVAADRTLRTTERAESATRFSRAIDQLGARVDHRKSIEIRLGGIYALKEYALHPSLGSPAESAEAGDTTVDVLSAYLRNNAPWPPPGASGSTAVPPVPRGCENEHARASGAAGPDVDAAVHALQEIYATTGARSTAYVPSIGLELSATDLRRADLSDMRLIAADLAHANLAGADLSYSDIRDTDLTGADLRDACLNGVNLDEIRQPGVKLTGAVACREDPSRFGADTVRCQHLH